MSKRPPINFHHINRLALRSLPVILGRWLPRGCREGLEYVALNPTRNDRRLGSFRINLRTGRWADFATGDRGGDVISLAAYLSRLTQTEAAEQLADMLGIDLDARYGR
jgi:DNA primase